MFGFNRVYRSHVTVYVVLVSPVVSYVFAISDVLVVSDIVVAVFEAFPNPGYRNTDREISSAPLLSRPKF
jgi:hypothetical protein